MVAETGSGGRLGAMVLLVVLVAMASAATDRMGLVAIVVEPRRLDSGEWQQRIELNLWRCSWW